MVCSGELITNEDTQSRSWLFDLIAGRSVFDTRLLPRYGKQKTRGMLLARHQAARYLHDSSSSQDSRRDHRPRKGHPHGPLCSRSVRRMRRMRRVVSTFQLGSLAVQQDPLYVWSLNGLVEHSPAIYIIAGLISDAQDREG
jgi:hypothetical protein